MQRTIFSMRYLGLLLVAALVAALAPSGMTPAASAAEARELIISGDTSGYVDVELRRQVRAKCCRRLDPVTGFLEGLEIETEGSYAALVIERLSDRKVMFVAVRLPTFDALAGRTLIQDLLWKQRFVPDHYRIYLFTDGESTASLTMQGLENDIRVRPTRAVRDQALIADLDAWFALQRYDLETTKDSFAIAVALNAAQYGQSSYQELCITKRGSDCDDTDARIAHATLGPSTTKRHDILAAFFTSADLPKGPSEALVTVVSPGSTIEGELFVLIAQ